MKKRRSVYWMLLLTTISLTACKNNNNSVSTEAQAIPVVVESITPASVAPEIYVSGNIEGNKTVRLGFMVAGKINYIAVNEGQQVGKGQLIASLDPVNYSIAKEMADVQVNQATDEYNRLKMMHDRNSLSESDLKKIEFALQQAQAQQKLQNENLSNTKLYSPISGVLLKKLAEPGEIIGTGNPILVISDINKVKVNAYIPENQLSQIHIGQAAQVQIDALNESYSGKVTEVGSAADATTRAFTVKIEIDNKGLKIRPGMIASVTLVSAAERSLLTVPAQAILRTPEGQTYVFVADKDRAQAYQRNISIGRMYSNKVEVISGLAEGEIVITGGQQKLSNGSSILITQND